MLLAVGCTPRSSTPAETSPVGGRASSSVPLAAPGTTPVGAPDCSDERLAGDLGEIGYAACQGEWAAVQPRRYTDSCIDCETIWLARWSGASWGLRARCAALVVLTAEEHGCATVTGTFATEAAADGEPEIPPADVACTIWGFNTVEEALETTGCPG